MPNVTCGADFSITIPDCLLQGLTLDDLTLNDPSCLAADYGTTGVGEVSINPQLIGCGVVTSVSAYFILRSFGRKLKLSDDHLFVQSVTRHVNPYGFISV